MEVTRRGLIIGITTFLCAPAIVRVSNIMPVKPVPSDLLVMCDFGPPGVVMNFSEGVGIVDGIRRDIYEIFNIPEEHIVTGKGLYVENGKSVSVEWRIYR